MSFRDYRGSMMPRGSSSMVLFAVVSLASSCGGEQPTEGPLPENAPETGSAAQDASGSGRIANSSETSIDRMTKETGATLESGTQSLDSASKAERAEVAPSCVPGALSCPSQGNATCCTYCDCMTEVCGTWFANRDACMTHCLGLRQDQLCCQYSYCLASKTGPHCNHGGGECCACPQ